MRIASVVVLLGMLSACDSDSRKAPSVGSNGFHAPVKTSLYVPTAIEAPDPGAVSFGDTASFGDASCFAVVDLPANANASELVLVTRDDGAIELVTGDVREVIVAAGSDTRRVSACALSLDGKGQPEVVVAFSAGDASETVHYRRDAGIWSASRIAPFAAAQVAFNAKSPRGSEVIVVDAWSNSVHAIFDGTTWQERALPASAFAEIGELAVAVTADADGRSHFALGANYYGDRAGQYVYWPSERGPLSHTTNGAGGLAIVIDPADPAQMPQIIHAENERAAGSANVDVTNLYRTVIGPDSSSTTLWSEAIAVIGFAQHFAPGAGQLAARIDADGYLHTLASVLDERTYGSTWAIDYVNDRAGSPRHTTLDDVRATGTVALGDRGLFASDHGKLVAAERTSAFGPVEPAPIIAPPAVGTVDVCDAGFTNGTEPLRHMTGLSAVVLADASDDSVHALEWDFDRRAVRQTTGDVVGWDTREVTPWSLDTMSAGRSQMLSTSQGDHLVWPEGNGLAHWTDTSGHWSKSSPSFENVIGTPDLSSSKTGVWLSAIVAPGAHSELVVSQLDNGNWSAPTTIEVDGTPEAQDLVDGSASPTILFAERPIDSATADLVMAIEDDGRWLRKDLGFHADHIVSLRATRDAEDRVVALVALEDAIGSTVVALRFDLMGPTELGRWTTDAAPSTLVATTLEDGTTMLAWDDGNAFEAATITGTTLGRRTLSAPEGGVLWTGNVTRNGRLVAVVQRTIAPGSAAAPYAIDLIGEACAR